MKRQPTKPGEVVVVRLSPKRYQIRRDGKPLKDEIYEDARLPQPLPDGRTVVTVFNGGKRTKLTFPKPEAVRGAA